eukprot:GHVN01082188.1.p3 GENE.GHVN01082188.1~~GHVN01082188.1.p3  ORF type:complete len:103 (-),score=6.33 GHVN01082188.1:326-634(-)
MDMRMNISLAWMNNSKNKTHPTKRQPGLRSSLILVVPINGTHIILRSRPLSLTLSHVLRAHPYFKDVILDGHETMFAVPRTGSNLFAETLSFLDDCGFQTTK